MLLYALVCTLQTNPFPVSPSHATILTCNRSILYAPFIPFIVIFCHILEVSDRTDLARLSDVVRSLEPICSLSEAIDKLYRLCNVLFTIAELYVEAKAQNMNAQTPDEQLASMGQEFEGYLAALGLAPGLGTMPPGSAPAAGIGAEGVGTGGYGEGVPGAMFGEGGGLEGQAMGGGGLQLGNWFSGNQYMMGLLEEDLEIFKGI